MNNTIGAVQQAFLDQQKFTEAEADAYQEVLSDVNGHNMTQAMLQLARSQDIRDYTDFPTQLEPEELNQQTASHPHLANYDHSLDLCRNNKVGLKKMPEQCLDGEEDADGISMGNMTSQDIL